MTALPVLYATDLVPRAPVRALLHLAGGEGRPLLPVVLLDVLFEIESGAPPHEMPQSEAIVAWKAVIESLIEAGRYRDATDQAPSIVNTRRARSQRVVLSRFVWSAMRRDIWLRGGTCLRASSLAECDVVPSGAPIWRPLLTRKRFLLLS